MLEFLLMSGQKATSAEGAGCRQEKPGRQKGLNQMVGLQLGKLFRAL
jgi:hypothetical protein